MLGRFLILSLAWLLIGTSGLSAAEKLKALIIDGQNNHAMWPKTTFMMKQYLEESGLFTVDIRRTKYTWKGDNLLAEFPLNDGRDYEALKQPKADPDFRPDFSKYDVVVSNFGNNAAAWPDETKQNLESFVNQGGGLVIVHAADNAFGDWDQFNKMIGLGGWGGRTERQGPYVYFNDDEKLIRDTSAGRGGSHGPQHPYQIIVRNAEHPITKGMPREWLHAQDELYDSLRGPAENMTVLATAYSSKDKRGTGRHEPMIMTIAYGQGRVFHTPMGHADYSVECVGFIATFNRGTEWAATGKVTQELPSDFPSPDQVRQRKFTLNKTAAAETKPEQAWVEYEGKAGPGKGKHVVLVAGDDEYRSEEALPMLGKILSQRHGFKCTVLFPIDPETGEIKPDYQNNIPGLEALDTADMMIIACRFRELPDAQMKHIVDYVNSGKPILGLRTATHSFRYKNNPDSPYANWSFNSKQWPGGFGQQVLGETWVSHHGKHKKESTRGIAANGKAAHPVLRGVHDVWGPTDVYGIKNLPSDADVLMHGQVLVGMNPSDKPVEGPKNNPMMPLVWLRDYQGESGKVTKVVCTTMGSSNDFLCEDLRRLVVNACYWSTGLTEQLPEKADVELVGEYEPSFYGFGTYQQGVKPADHRLE